MLYNLIKTSDGKDTIVMTDSLKKVNNRLKTLRDSQRGKKINYSVVPTDSTNKFRQKPHDGSYAAGDYQTPKKVQ